MNEIELLSQIRTLTEKRQRLRESHAGIPLSRATTEQLNELEGEVEASWAQLRQRRAWRYAGHPPDGPSDSAVAGATASRRSATLVRQPPPHEPHV